MLYGKSIAVFSYSDTGCFTTPWERIQSSWCEMRTLIFSVMHNTLLDNRIFIWRLVSAMNMDHHQVVIRVHEEENVRKFCVP